MDSNVYNIIDGIPIVKVCTEEMIRSVWEYKPQPDDVFLVSYPKSGTTWIQHIVYNILMDGKESEDQLDMFWRIPFLEIRGADAAIHGRKPGALKIHQCYGKTPHSKDAKYIYIARNPYDSCVSNYYHYKHFPAFHFSEGTFDQFVDYFTKGEVDFGDYLDHAMSWYEHRNDENVLFLTYEGLQKCRPKFIMKIAQFLGEEHEKKLRDSPDLFDRMLEMTSFDRMKEIMTTKGLLKNPMNTEGIHPSLIKGLYLKNGYMRQPIKGSFIRKGVVGDWKNHFSKEQIKTMKEWIDLKTRGSDIMSLWRDVDLP